MTELEIARVCHEVNKAYCLALGDTSQVPWEAAPDWQKKSALHGVEAIHGNPDLPPSHSHENWLEEKRAAGWGWGIAKDAELKVHPCFVPYDQLPPEQKAKDYIFGAVVRALLAVEEGRGEDTIPNHGPDNPAPAGSIGG